MTELQRSGHLPYPMTWAFIQKEHDEIHSKICQYPFEPTDEIEFMSRYLHSLVVMLHNDRGEVWF